jgi:hypothetical protein
MKAASIVTKTMEKPAKQAGRLEKLTPSRLWFSLPTADFKKLSGKKLYNQGFNILGSSPPSRRRI